MAEQYTAPHAVFCLISDERVFQSQSPAIFNRVMTALGLPATYVAFRVDPPYLSSIVASLKALNISGANISAPYKEAIMPYVDAVSESANIIGAVNTIAVSEGRAKGYNTNAIGIMDALEDAEFEPAGKIALILGAGGAAKAAAFVLRWLKIDEIFIAGRNGAKARALADRIEGEALGLTPSELSSHAPHIIVNATTISSTRESPELSKMAGSLDTSNCELVYDLNYGRRSNIWQALAKNRSIPFVDGLDTLVHQARNSLALWTGLDIGPARFRNALAGWRPQSPSAADQKGAKP
jgi:shikimate dehydrogenase